jgi:hypothetical protein
MPNAQNWTTRIYFNLFLKLPMEKRENVIGNSSNFIISHFNKSNIKISFLPNEYLTEGYYKENTTQIYVQPLWSEWSLCGDCDKTSIRNRIGNCFFNFENSLNSELNYIQRIYFPNGAPCYLNAYYKYLPDAFLAKDVFKNYNFFETCMVKCLEYQFENDTRLVGLVSIQFIFI